MMVFLYISKSFLVMDGSVRYGIKLGMILLPIIYDQLTGTSRLSNFENSA
jgi:hypothetical protein